jgi:hypothetical protein
VRPSNWAEVCPATVGPGRVPKVRELTGAEMPFMVPDDVAGKPESGLTSLPEQRVE